jgi:hypothetical protein
MSLFLYPVSKSKIEGINDAPSIYCSYGVLYCDGVL